MLALSPYPLFILTLRFIGQSREYTITSFCKEIEDTGYGYRYKDILPVSLLGLVYDMIGVTYAGYRAQQMNVIINVKTAEKTTTIWRY